jgi:hypothetical protein
MKSIYQRNPEIYIGEPCRLLNLPAPALRLPRFDKICSELPSFPGWKHKAVLTYGWATACEQTEDQIMPDWILAPICLVALLGFIGFAFRQGTKVKPDRDNSNFGPNFTGSDGNGGSGDGGGHSS